MPTKRRFSRFNRSLEGLSGTLVSEGLVTTNIPEGGLCLSAFDIVVPKSNPNAALLGYVNPEAPWDEIGALDESRIKAHSSRWMVPSCHLMLGESPQDAAKRIAKEQLELEGLSFSEPKVNSEYYHSPNFPQRPLHWDIEFIFKGVLSDPFKKRPSAWRRLEFVDLSKTSKSKIARSHEDILESAGLRFGQG